MDEQFQNQNPHPFDYQNKPVLTVGDWFITLLITAIPLIGFIMLFVWALGSGTNPNKANWAKAALIWMVIAIVIYIIIFVTIGTAMFKGFSS